MPEVYEFLEAERIKYAIRLPANQVLAAEQDRLSAQAPSRTTSAPCAPVPCQFQLSGRNLDQAAEGYRQGRVASRRTLSPRRLHRDEHEPPGRARRCFLQQARDVRAMDQGGQRRDQVDATVVPNVCRQRGAAPASCARLQPRQLPAHAGDARADQGLVADDLEGQADQDRREGRYRYYTWRQRYHAQGYRARKLGRLRAAGCQRPTVVPGRCRRCCHGARNGASSAEQAARADIDPTRAAGCRLAVRGKLEQNDSPPA